MNYPADGAANSQSSTQSNNMWQLADKILNSDSLNLDSANGIFQWKGSKFDLGNNLVMNARFVRYLSSPGYPDTAQTYQQVLKQIQDLLANDPNANGNLTDAQKNDRVVQAWQLLADAAKYPQDGGASQTLANQVWNAWSVRAELGQNRQLYEAVLAKEKLKQKQLSYDISAAKGQAQAYDPVKPTGKLNNNNNGGGSPGAGGTAIGAQSVPYSDSRGLSRNSNYAQDNSTVTTPNDPSAGAGNTSLSHITGSDGLTTNSNDSGYKAMPGVAANGGNTRNTYNNNGNGDGGGDQSKATTQPLAGLGDVGTGLMSSQISSMGKLGYAGPNMSTAAVDSSDLARLYAQETLLDTDATTIGLKAKSEYQAVLLGFIGERYFQHSLLAGMFYEHLFKGSQQRVEAAAQQMSKYINTDNIVPSVNSFEFISHEAIAEVDNGMKAVESAYDAGDHWTALQQLEQVFLLGERLPSVLQFDAAKRRVLLNIYREANDLRNTMTVHDFASAETALQKLRVDAPDFEATPIVSAIKSAEQTSNNYVIAASQAAVAGDTGRVTDNLRKAAEIWPMNPEITSMSKNMLNRSNLQNVGGQKFDEFLAQKNDRAIYEARDEIGIAVYQDPDRAAQLKAILNRMGQVEMSIAFADQAMKQDNGYAAWETLQAAAEIEPNDPMLSNAMRKVAPRVANFVSALDSAEQASKAGDYGTAMNFYLQAQDIYPASRIAHDALADLGAKLMAKLNPKGPSAKALSAKGAALDAAAAKEATPAKVPADANAANKTSSL